MRETILAGNSNRSYSQFTASTKLSSNHDVADVCFDNRWLHRSRSSHSENTSSFSLREDFSLLPEVDQQHWGNLALKARPDTSERPPPSFLDWDEVEHESVQERNDRVSPLDWSSIESSLDRKKESPLDWASLNSDQSSKSTVPPPPSHLPPQSSLSSSFSCETEGTPVTTMGRGKSLRLKVYTYHVQSSEDLYDDGSIRSYLSEATRTPDFGVLLQDPAYRHAQKAGYLWQTIVGQHVKFPSRWWDGARTPRMGADEVLEFGGKRGSTFPWKYISCDRVPTNSILTALVKNRSSPGRLLLHIVVRDLMTWAPVQDICVGMYHPNARGVRTSESPQHQEEWSRDVWIAARNRTDQHTSVMDSLLPRGTVQESPLGVSRKVNNQNMRAVFGEAPPVATIFMLESELFERMNLAVKLDRKMTPVAMLFLREFMTVR